MGAYRDGGPFLLLSVLFLHRWTAFVATRVDVVNQ
jgi:hypothetical protein